MVRLVLADNCLAYFAQITLLGIATDLPCREHIFNKCNLCNINKFTWYLGLKRQCSPNWGSQTIYTQEVHSHFSIISPVNSRFLYRWNHVKYSLHNPWICKYKKNNFQPTDELLFLVRIVSVAQLAEYLRHEPRSHVRFIDWVLFTQLEKSFNNIYLKNLSILWLKFKGFVFALVILYETILFF